MNSATPKLKVDAIRELLLTRIQSGIYAQGSLLPTEIDLAAELSASRGTVSKALSSLVHMGLLERKPRVGTRVLNTAAPSAEGQGAGAYAFIYPGEHHPAIWEIVCGFHEAAQAAGRRTLLLSTGTDFEEETHLLRQLSGFQVKAVAVYPLTVNMEQRHRIEKALQESECPVVLAGSILPGVGVPAVVASGFDAGYTMTRHLLEKGCKTVGFLSNDSLCATVRDRFLGYRKALEDAGLEMDSRYVLQDTDLVPDFESPVERCIDRAKAWMRQVGKLPDAVVCAHDYLAKGCLEAARQEGLKVPDDLRVVGMGGYFRSDLAGDAVLTSYDIPYREIGREVFLRLNRLSSGEEVGSADFHLYLKGRLLLGDTA